MERYLIKTSTPVSTSRPALWRSAEISRSKTSLSTRRSSIGTTPRQQAGEKGQSLLKKTLDDSQRRMSVRDERLMLILNKCSDTPLYESAADAPRSTSPPASDAATPIAAKINHGRDVANRENVPPRLAQKLLPQSNSRSAVKLTKDTENKMLCTPPARNSEDNAPVGEMPNFKHNPMILARLKRDLQSPSAATRVRAMKALKSPSKYENYFHFDVPNEEQDIITAEERLPMKRPTVQEIMKDLVVYVEFRNEEDNRSAGIKKVISQMGATVNDKLLRTTTHVIFKDGLLSTYTKAKALNIPIVNILWIEACKKQLRIVDPKDYPIANKDVYEHPELHKKIKRHKSMQPGAIDNIKVRKQKLKPDDLVSSPALQFDFSKKPSDKFRDIYRQCQDMQIPDGIEYDTPTRASNLDMNCNSSAVEGNMSKIAMTSLHQLLHLDTVSELGDSEICKTAEKQDVQETVSSSEEATVIPKKAAATPTRKSRRLSFQDSLVNTPSQDSSKTAFDAQIYSTPSQRTRRLSKSECDDKNSPSTPSTLRRSNRRSMVPSDADAKTPTQSVSRRRTMFTPFAETIHEERVDNLNAITMEIEVSQSASTRTGTRSACKRRTIFGSASMEMSVNVSSDQEKSSTICKKLSFDSTIMEEAVEEVIPSSQMTPKVTNRRRTMGHKVAARVDVPSAVEEISTDEVPVVMKSTVLEDQSTDLDLQKMDASTSDMTTISKVKRQTFHFTGLPDKLHKSSSLDQVVKKISTPGRRTTIFANKTPIKRVAKPQTPTTSSANPKMTLLPQSDLTESAKEKTDVSKRRTLMPMETKTTKTPVNDRRRTIYDGYAQKIQEINRLNKLNESLQNSPPKDVKQTAKAVQIDETLSQNVANSSPNDSNVVPLVSDDSQKLPLLEKTENNKTDVDEMQSPAVTKKRKLFPPTALYNQMFGSTPPQLLKTVSKSDKKKRAIDDDEFQTGAAKKKIKTADLRRSTMDFQVKAAASDGNKSNLAVSQAKLPLMAVTNLSQMEIDCVKEAVAILGGFEFSENVNSKATHLVTTEPRRTINLLRAVARGLWVLDISWVENSIKARKWLFEEIYELRHFSDAIEMCRVERQAVGSLYRSTLFSNVGPIYISSKCSVPAKDLIELTQLCGGKVTSNRSKAKAIVCDYAKKDVAAFCVSPLWILDSITHHKLQRTKNYHVDPLESKS